MYKKNPIIKGRITSNEIYEGESIEEKIERITTSGEAIKDGAPLIYTERKDGVNPAHNVKTDRWEIAAEAMDTVTKSKIASRENRGKIVDINSGEEIGGTEPTQGTK